MFEISRENRISLLVHDQGDSDTQISPMLGARGLAFIPDITAFCGGWTPLGGSSLHSLLPVRYWTGLGWVFDFETALMIDSGLNDSVGKVFGQQSTDSQILDNGIPHQTGFMFIGRIGWVNVGN